MPVAFRRSKGYSYLLCDVINGKIAILHYDVYAVCTEVDGQNKS